MASFTGTNGAQPYAGLVLGSDGDFYGTSLDGGLNSKGTVFKVTTNGSLTTLVSFDGANGAFPQAGLVLGDDGSLYGTTPGVSGSFATVFRVTTNGMLTSLVMFGGPEFASSQAGLLLGRDGNFYGTTYGGGNAGLGTVFKVATNGALTTLEHRRLLLRGRRRANKHFTLLSAFRSLTPKQRRSCVPVRKSFLGEARTAW